MHETKCANGAKRRVKMRQLFYKQKEGKKWGDYFINQKMPGLVI